MGKGGRIAKLLSGVLTSAFKEGDVYKTADFERISKMIVTGKTEDNAVEHNNEKAVSVGTGMLVPEMDKITAANYYRNRGISGAAPIYLENIVTGKKFELRRTDPQFESFSVWIDNTELIESLFEFDEDDNSVSVYSMGVPGDYASQGIGLTVLKYLAERAKMNGKDLVLHSVASYAVARMCYEHISKNAQYRIKKENARRFDEIDWFGKPGSIQIQIADRYLLKYTKIPGAEGFVYLPSENPDSEARDIENELARTISVRIKDGKVLAARDPSAGKAPLAYQVILSEAVSEVSIKNSDIIPAGVKADGGSPVDLKKFLLENFRSQNIVQIDLWDNFSWGKAMPALKAGNIVEIGLLDPPATGRNGYLQVRDNLTALADLIYEGLGDQDKYFRDANVVLLETFKNAFLYGNCLDYRLPIFIRIKYDDKAGPRSFEIYDTASEKALTAEQRQIAAEIKLGDPGQAINLIKWNWDYKRDSLEGFKGTKVTITRLSNKLDAESGLTGEAGAWAQTLQKYGGAGALKIPSTAYNAATSERLKNFIGEIVKYKQELLNTGNNVLAGYEKIGRSIQESAGFDESVINIGNTVVSFAGGIDVFLFGLNRQANGVKDLLIIDKRPFGYIQDIYQPNHLSALERYYEIGSDSGEALDKTPIIGNIALERIMFGLSGEIKGVYYFEINPDGTLQFLAEKQLSAVPANRNAVIEFADTENKTETKRFWYIQQDINEDSSGFLRFITGLSFDTLVIKAAFDLFSEGSGLFYRQKAIEKIIVPARKNNALVITDSDDNSKVRYPIWALNPKSLALNGIKFGLSNRVLHFGRAERLISDNPKGEKDGGRMADRGAPFRGVVTNAGGARWGGQDYRLREYILKSDPGREVVDVDLWADEYIDPIIEAVRSDKAVALHLSNGVFTLGEKESKLSNKLKFICIMLAREFNPFPDPAVQKSMFEVLKNAFVHGNKTDMSVPIYLYLKLDNIGWMDALMVYNNALDAQFTEMEKQLLLNSGWSGKNKGVNNLQKKFKYEIQELQDIKAFKVTISHLNDKNAAAFNTDGGDKGGIDLRSLPIASQPGSVLAAGVNSKLADMDMEGEWKQIQNMVNSGFIPNMERIRDYAAACCQKGVISRQKGNILLCVAEILRIEEDKNLDTDPGMKELLVSIDRAS
jgi:hypothetical protein